MAATVAVDIRPQSVALYRRAWITSARWPSSQKFRYLRVVRPSARTLALAEAAKVAQHARRLRLEGGSTSSHRRKAADHLLPALGPLLVQANVKYHLLVRDLIVPTM